MIYKIKLENKHIDMLKENLGIEKINPKDVEDLSYCIQTLIQITNDTL